MQVSFSYFSKKMVTQAATAALTYGAAWVVLHYGIVLSAAQSALVSAAIAWAAGAFAGWFTRETTVRVLAPPVKTGGKA